MRITRENVFVAQEYTLFPRKWDQSRFTLTVRIDRSLNTVECVISGYGGRHGEPILLQGVYEGECVGWDYVLEHSFGRLADQVEMQCDDTI